MAFYAAGVLAGAYRGGRASLDVTRRHLVSDEPTSVGRLKRAAGQAMCNPKLDVIDPGGYEPVTMIDCPKCMEIAKRIVADVEATIGPSVPKMLVPRSPSPNAKNPKDDEAPCVVCDKPVKLGPSTSFLWIHYGGSHAVTAAEGQALNASGRESADLGLQPVGSDCLRRHPELLPYVMKKEDDQ